MIYPAVFVCCVAATALAAVGLVTAAMVVMGVASAVALLAIAERRP